MERVHKSHRWSPARVILLSAVLTHTQGTRDETVIPFCNRMRARSLAQPATRALLTPTTEINLRVTQNCARFACFSTPRCSFTSSMPHAAYYHPTHSSFCSVQPHSPQIKLIATQSRIVLLGEKSQRITPMGGILGLLARTNRRSRFYYLRCYASSTGGNCPS